MANGLKDIAELVKAAADLIAQNRGAFRINQERIRQVSEEGWTAEHDDEHDDEELAWAAAVYLLTGRFTLDGQDVSERFWPWPYEGFKADDDRVRNLVKAGALIAAEIDRLLRKDEA